MPDITVLPEAFTFTVSVCSNLRQALKQAGFALSDRCGGMGACCSCVVRLVEGQLSEKTDLEAMAFTLQADERLACQCNVLTDVTVDIAGQC